MFNQDILNIYRIYIQNKIRDYFIVLQRTFKNRKKIYSEK